MSSDMSPKTSLDDLAGLHAQCFTGHPRPWSAAEIADLRASSGCFLLSEPALHSDGLHGDALNSGGFLIGRALAGEAELLTLAVNPLLRRQGIGLRLLARFAAKAGEMGAEQAFLEVASDNPGAQALYARDGWRKAGQRRNYYAQGIDALVLTRGLGA